MVSNPFAPLIGGLKVHRLPVTQTTHLVVAGRRVQHGTRLNGDPEEPNEVQEVRRARRQAYYRNRHQQRKQDPAYRAQRAEYQMRNAERIKAYRREYAQKNADHLRAYKAEWARKKRLAQRDDPNARERINAQQRERYERKREELLAAQRVRQARYREAKRLAQEGGAM